jgi:hypothetical protein
MTLCSIIVKVVGDAHKVCETCRVVITSSGVTPILGGGGGNSDICL